MISTARASQIFGDVCAAHAPTFAGTEDAAAGYGFVQNTSTGTYYHPRENLSVKLANGDCSMVFASDADPLELENALVEVTMRENTPTPLSADFRRRSWPYYSAVIGPT